MAHLLGANSTPTPKQAKGQFIQLIVGVFDNGIQTNCYPDWALFIVSTTVNEIHQIAQSILKILKENFPNSSITSVKVHRVWLDISLGRSPLENAERVKRQGKF